MSTYEVWSVRLSDWVVCSVKVTHSAAASLWLTAGSPSPGFLQGLWISDTQALVSWKEKCCIFCVYAPCSLAIDRDLWVLRNKPFSFKRDRKLVLICGCKNHLVASPGLQWVKIVLGRFTYWFWFSFSFLSWATCWNLRREVSSQRAWLEKTDEKAYKPEWLPQGRGWWLLRCRE